LELFSHMMNNEDFCREVKTDKRVLAEFIIETDE